MSINPRNVEKNAIVFASDDNYAGYVAVAILSILDNLSDDKVLHIVVLSNQISDINKSKICEVVSGRAFVDFIECNRKLSKFSDFIHNKRLSPTIFARFYILEYFRSFNRIVYLDCDVLLNCDIGELFCKKVSHPIAAVPDIFIETYSNIAVDMDNYIHAELGIQGRYFNSGVMMFDMERCSKYKEIDELFKLAASRVFRWEDQDVLNLFYKDNVCYLDYRWNVIWLNNRPIQETLENNVSYKDALKSPKIIHFAGGALPTKSIRTKFSKLWWSYAKRTPFSVQFEKQYVRLLFSKCINIVSGFFKLRD